MGGLEHHTRAVNRKWNAMIHSHAMQWVLLKRDAGSQSMLGMDPLWPVSSNGKWPPAWILPKDPCENAGEGNVNCIQAAKLGKSEEIPSSEPRSGNKCLGQDRNLGRGLGPTTYVTRRRKNKSWDHECGSLGSWKTSRRNPHSGTPQSCALSEPPVALQIWE